MTEDQYLEALTRALDGDEQALEEVRAWLRS